MSGHYRTIVADPPWPYQDGATPRQRNAGSRRFLPYQTMTVAAITQLIERMPAAIDCHLYLWTTQRFLRSSFEVVEAAGYMPGAILAWCKSTNGEGMGGAFPPTLEFVLVCRRNWGRFLERRRARLEITVSEIHRCVRGGPPTGLVSMWMKGERYPNEDDWDALYELLGDLGSRAGLHRQAPQSWFRWPRGVHSAKPDAFLDLVEQVSPGPYLELFARRQRLGWDTYGDEALCHVSLETK